MSRSKTSSVSRSWSAIASATSVRAARVGGRPGPTVGGGRPRPVAVDPREQVPAVQRERVDVLVAEPRLLERDAPGGVERVLPGRQPVGRQGAVGPEGHLAARQEAHERDAVDVAPVGVLGERTARHRAHPRPWAGCRAGAPGPQRAPVTARPAAAAARPVATVAAT